MAFGFVAPKKPDWFRATAVAATVVVVLYAAAAWWAPWAPGRLGGLIAGSIAAVIFLIDALYPLRRRLLAWPLRNAQQWLQFHVYGGVIACLLVLVHAGFRLPGGQFGWWLLLLTLWTTASGLFGVWLQKWIPNVIVNNLTVEALYDRIPELVSRLQAEADKVVVGSSEILDRAYQSEIRPLLAGVTPSWSYVFDVRARRDQRMTPLRAVEQFLGDDEKARLADLQAIFGEKTELDAHFSLQRALRLWLVLHVPPSLVLLGLTIVHFVTVLYL